MCVIPLSRSVTEDGSINQFPAQTERLKGERKLIFIPCLEWFQAKGFNGTELYTQHDHPSYPGGLLQWFVNHAGLSKLIERERLTRIGTPKPAAIVLGQ